MQREQLVVIKMPPEQNLERKTNAFLPSDHQKARKPDDESPSTLKSSKEANHDDEQKDEARPAETAGTNSQTWAYEGTKEAEIPISTSKAADKTEEAAPTESNGRERLKRHRVDVAGRVWIPDIWGQEELLKDWVDCSAFDASLMNTSIMSARAALVEERTRVDSGRLRIENSC